MSGSEDTGGEPVIHTATAAVELVQDAAARLSHLLMNTSACIGAEERRELEEAADDLRAALQYLEPQMHTHDSSGKN